MKVPTFIWLLRWLMLLVVITHLWFFSVLLPKYDSTRREASQSQSSAISPHQQRQPPNPTGFCAHRTYQWNSDHRSDRFPSVEERVCIYMTIWYDPYYGTPRQWKPKLHYQRVNTSTLNIYWTKQFLITIHMMDVQYMNDVPFFLFSSNISTTLRLSGHKNWALFIFYSREAIQFCEPFQPDIPILMAWGDQELQVHDNSSKNSPSVQQLPIVAKWRFNDLTRHTRPVPIIIPLEGMRHYDPLKSVKEHDIPWHEKKNFAIWRGYMSGIVDGKFPHHYKNTSLTPLQVCMRFPRCRLVYQNSNSTMADVGLSACPDEKFKNIQGVNMIRPNVDMKYQLQHKMLISVEGNDVASGLKWSLLSNSIVLMPPPTKSIFSMEFLLEPWVHYVPLNLDNVDIAIKWVLDHDDEAQLISKRATNFMNDLFFHPNATDDNEQVLHQIMDRISALWDTSASSSS